MTEDHISVVLDARHPINSYNKYGTTINNPNLFSLTEISKKDFFEGPVSLQGLSCNGWKLYIKHTFCWAEVGSCTCLNSNWLMHPTPLANRTPIALAVREPEPVAKRAGAGPAAQGGKRGKGRR